MRVYVGGSFDPVHVGHVAMFSHAQTTLQSHNLQAQLFALPTKGSPFKAAPASFKHRCNMLMLALEGLDVRIEKIEETMSAPAYSVDVLSKLAKTHSSSQVLMMGMDSWASLATWHRAKELSELCSLWVLKRAGSRESPPCDLGFETAQELPGLNTHGCVFFDSYTPPQASSSALKDSHFQSESLLPRPVARYIRDHNLYR